MNKYVLTEDNSLAEILRKTNFNIISSLEELPIEKSIVLMVSFSKIISKTLLLKHFFLNIHNSLLPKYRGLHAFTWAIINNETQTGYTIHRVTENIDDGPILNQITIPIGFESNINDLFLYTRPILIDFVISEYNKLDIVYINSGLPQNEFEATYVPRRKNIDGLINWNQKSLDIYNLIRSLAPPYTSGAFAKWMGQNLYIKTAKFIEFPKYISTPGQVVARYPSKGVLVKCKDRPLLIKEVIFEGVEMNAYDLFKTVGARLGKF